MRLIDADELKKRIHQYVKNPDPSEEWTRDQEFSMDYIVSTAPTVDISKTWKLDYRRDDGRHEDNLNDRKEPQFS